MLTFNAVLRHEGIDPKEVRLVRHQDTRPDRVTPYNLWLAGNSHFETYQRIQGRQVFSAGNLLASFVSTPMDDTLFVGLYRVDGIGKVSPDIVDPGTNATPPETALFYDIAPDDRLAPYRGLLTVDWGKGYRAWVQRAELRDMPIREIRTRVREDRFPGFTTFCWDVDRIESIPLAWQEVLKAVKGVYLLVCKECGKQYVGSAKGEDSLWGRFLDYAGTVHGGNVELKKHAHRRYQATVLEVVNSDAGIERIEEAWKQKVQSREFGLNRN